MVLNNRIIISQYNMGIIVENRLITLNSRYCNRVNGTFLSSVEFPFRGILTDEDDIVSANICIMNAQIPVSWYTINETNYQFRALNLTTWISIPFGNYTANTLLPLLKTLMNTAVPNSVSSVTLDATTGKISFSFTSTLFVIFPNVFQNGKSGNYVYLLFGATANNQYTGDTVSLTYPMNLLGINRLAIRSSKLLISSFNSFDNGLGINLATIPADQPPWGLINYTNQTDLNKAVLMVKTIDMIDIQIADEFNNLINFNNTDWTMTLVLEVIKNIPERFIPHFKELTVEAKVPEKEKPIIQDMKELEMLA